MELQPSPQTVHFKKEVKRLISTGKIAKQQEVVDALEWNKTSMSSVMAGRVNVPAEVYKKFLRVYMPSKQYLGMEGHDPIIMEGGIDEYAAKQKSSSTELDLKDELIKALRENNALLKAQLNYGAGVQNPPIDVPTLETLVVFLIRLRLGEYDGMPSDQVVELFWREHTAKLLGSSKNTHAETGKKGKEKTAR